MKLIDSNLINEKKLPNEVKIATISVTCKIDCDINILDIWNFFPLNSEIETIKFNKEIKSTNLKLLEKEKKKREKKLQKKKLLKKKKTRKTGDNFYNCIIIVVKVSEEKIINIKLFRNGSIQMTGSKNLNQTDKALTIILKYLKAKYYKKINNKKVLVPLLVRRLTVEEEKKISSIIKESTLSDEEIKNKIRNFRFSPKMKFDYRKLRIRDFLVNMINTSFSLDFKIHLGELTKILEEEKDCIVTYEPSIHAGINIKIDRDETKEKKPIALIPIS